MSEPPKKYAWKTYLLPGLVAGLIGTWWAIRYVDSGSIDAELRTFADQARRGLPAMVNEDLRLDKITVGPGRRLNYAYTFVRATAFDIDPDKVRSTVIPGLRKFVCTNPEAQVLVKAGVQVGYEYSDRDGSRVFNHVVDTKYACAPGS